MALKENPKENHIEKNNNDYHLNPSLFINPTKRDASSGQRTFTFYG